MGPQSHGVRECNGLPATENIETVSVSEASLRRVTIQRERLGLAVFQVLLGALMITNTILGAPYYNHGIVGPKALF